MSSAAIYFHPEGFNTDVRRLMGRHSAGESFLKGFIRHADVERFHFWNVVGRPNADLQVLIDRIHAPTKPVAWIGSRQRSRLAEAGCVYLPGPALSPEAWARRPFGAKSYSICGVTHTTASDRVMDAIAEMLAGPVEPWDALICTSAAVRASVEAELEVVRADLADRLGATRFASPRIETIPLGINVADFAPDPQAGRVWRDRLAIPQHATVALYMGRLNYAAKMNPATMALALEAAARQSGREIHWIVSGWAENDKVGEILHTNTRALCPSVHYHQVDGRPPDVRFTIWHAADFFISFSDNIQETFGLTPVEAMAAGLPAVISDWNGYRDTVRDGLDGFRIPTTAPRPGMGRDLAYMNANAWISYSNYVGAAAQMTAVDLRAATQAIYTLVENPELRRKMGASARERALQTFDWSTIIPKYQALWTELGAIRRTAPAKPQRPGDVDNPRRMDPFQLFFSYPSRFIMPGTRLALSSSLTWADAKMRLSNPLARFADFALPTLHEAERVYDFLSSRTSATAGEIAANFPEGRKVTLERGLGWLLKFGVIRVTE